MNPTTPYTFWAVPAYTWQSPYTPCALLPGTPAPAGYQPYPASPWMVQTPLRKSPCIAPVPLKEDPSPSALPAVHKYLSTASMLRWDYVQHPNFATVSAISGAILDSNRFLDEPAVPDGPTDCDMFITFNDTVVATWMLGWGPLWIKSKGKKPITIRDVLYAISDFLHVPLQLSEYETLGKPQWDVMFQRRDARINNNNAFCHWMFNASLYEFRRIDLFQEMKFLGLSVNRKEEKELHLTLHIV